VANTLIREAEGYELLKKSGIPVPRYEIARSSSEAAKAADRIGYPVVMKVISPQIVHKSDAGGVVTGIGNAGQAREAYDSIIKNAAVASPAAVIDGVMVEEQLSSGLELIIGGKTDSTFGKVLTVGFGGILVELLRDAATRVLPIDTNEIVSMIRGLHGYPLIAGYRIEPARDEQALVAMIQAVAGLFL